jgi:hypothetical protein
MNRHILAWVASAALLGAAGAAPAMADDSGATQALGQSATNQQSADSDAKSTQVNPTNQNISVRVLSPGDDGSVSQTNASQALSAAGNLNKTSQSASQTQGGGGGTQAAGQTADSKQSADADASSTQLHPSNQNIDVRVLSPGDNGSVSQTNASQAEALAGNANKTEQTADQTQGGGGGTQAVGQDASNKQKADADAKSKQVEPTNQNIGVRVLSPGNDGSVKQTNASQAAAVAGNANKTTQDASQNQGASQPLLSSDRCKSSCDGGSSGTQAIGQDASNKQDANADASSTQIHPSNVNAPVRVLSPGDNGKVEQSNVSSADALAVNLNKTEQSGEQNQYGSGHSAPAPRCEYGCDGHGDSTGIQALGQSATNKQDANANADSKQIGASNVNAPVRVGSEGDNGKVEQANVSSAAAVAGNLNKTEQSGEQNQGGGLLREAAAPRCDYGCGDHSGTAIQALGQQAYSDQKANADASSKQTGASNVNAPVREDSAGDNGSVKQLNASDAEALAFNVNHTDQSAQQDQSGPGHGTAIQALGQDAGNRQHADADATSEQICPVNLNAPVSVGGQDRKQKSKYEKAPKLSKGGSVMQANLSRAASAAGNKNRLTQWGAQYQ